MTTAMVIAAGAFGAMARFVMAGAVQRTLATEWPWGTALVNSIGALGIGLVTGLDIGVAATAVIAGGLAGFTTFSTWVVEAAALWAEGDGGHRRALIDVVVPLVAGLALACAGLGMGRLL
jgi:CrcB protein